MLTFSMSKAVQNTSIQRSSGSAASGASVVGISSELMQIRFLGACLCLWGWEKKKKDLPSILQPISNASKGVMNLNPSSIITLRGRG